MNPADVTVPRPPLTPPGRGPGPPGTPPSTPPTTPATCMRLERPPCDEPPPPAGSPNPAATGSSGFADLFTLLALTMPNPADSVVRAGVGAVAAGAVVEKTFVTTGGGAA